MSASQPFALLRPSNHPEPLGPEPNLCPLNATESQLSVLLEQEWGTQAWLWTPEVDAVSLKRWWRASLQFDRLSSQLPGRLSPILGFVGSPRGWEPGFCRPDRCVEVRFPNQPTRCVHRPWRAHIFGNWSSILWSPNGTPILHAGVTQRTPLSNG